MGLNDILLSVLLITATALCIYLIIIAKKLHNTLENTNSILDDFRRRVDPLVENLTEISEKMLSFSDQAERQISEYSRLFDELRQRINSLTNIKQLFSSSHSTDSFSKNVSAMRKGVKAFWSRLFN